MAASGGLWPETPALPGAARQEAMEAMATEKVRLLLAIGGFSKFGFHRRGREEESGGELWGETSLRVPLR